MRKSYKQSELIKVLNDNPLSIKAKFNEVEINGEDFIFLDRIQDLAITRDNGAVYKSIILVSIYSKDMDVIEVTLSYLKSLFICNPVFTKEEDYCKSTIELELFVKWGV